MELDGVMVEAGLEVVAPTLPPVSILPHHGLLQSEQQERVPHTHHQGLGTSDDGVEHRWVTDTLGVVA